MEGISVAIIFVVSIGICLNAIFTITIFIRPLQNYVATVLLGNQSIFDGLACLMTLLNTLIPSYMVSSNGSLYDVLGCHIWGSKYLYLLFIMASVQNIVCITIDRYIAVLRPSTYRSSKKKFLISTSIYIILMSIIIPLPALCFMKISNNTCIVSNIYPGIEFKNFLLWCAIIWTFSIYIGPVLFLSIAYWRIIRKLKKSVMPDLNDIDKEKLKGTHQLTISVFIATVIFICTFTFDNICYILSQFDIVEYTPGGVKEKIGLFIVTINSVLSPLSYFCFMKSFRVRFYSLFICKNKKNF